MGGLGDITDFVGTWIGELATKEDRERAEQLALAAAHKFDGMDPNLSADRLGPSASQGLKADPKSRAARMAALERLMQMGMEGGWDAESRAANAEAQQQAGQYEQAQRGALMADAQRRGMMGSNLSMASQLGAQQAGAQRAGMQGIQASADARKRALAALAQSGDLAGGLERDDFSQRLGLADRMDAIDRFNTQNANQFKQGNFTRDMDVRGAQYDAAQDEADIYNRRADRTTGNIKKGSKAAGSAAEMGLKGWTGGLF